MAIFVMLSFAQVSLAVSMSLSVDNEAGEITNPGNINLTSFFYRTGENGYSTSDDYTYGYGYGYADGEYYDGYGYGYGYAYFAQQYGPWWENGDLRAGFFLGTEEGVFSSVDLSVNDSGFAYMLIDFGLIEDTMGAEIHFPEGLEITADLDWTGEMSLEVDLDDDVVTVSLETGGYDLAFDDAVILLVPNIDVDEDDLLVEVSLSSDPNIQFVISSCAELGSGYYTEDPEDEGDLLDSNSYDLEFYASRPAESHCYNFYDDDIYIATMHASDFSVESEDSGSVGSSSSGSVGNSSNESSNEELVLDDVSDFVDMEGIAIDDWRYQALAAVFESGLFKGSKNAAGDAVIDLEGGMNRAMAATVLARYLECDTVTAPAEKPFPDVDTDMWYAPSVACLADMGVVSGKVHVDPPIYDPGGAVTRGEYLKLFIESYLVKHPTMETDWRLVLEAAPTEFTDLSVDDWYAGYFELAYDNGLIAGYIEDGLRYAKGNKSIIRVEAMKIAGDFLALGDE